MAMSMSMLLKITKKSRSVTGFLKGQHDDLIEAEKTLVGIIEELDTGMRKQFMENLQKISARV